MILKYKLAVATVLFCAAGGTWLVVDGAQPAHTRAWFKAHPSEMRATLKACSNDAALERASANCENAGRASDDIFVDEAEAAVKELDAEARSK
jgi:hypothetical protein